jgi:hypothetical protein
MDPHLWWGHVLVTGIPVVVWGTMNPRKNKNTSHQGKKEEQKNVSKEYGNMVQRSTKNSNNQTKQMFNDRTRAWQ